MNWSTLAGNTCDYNHMSCGPSVYLYLSVKLPELLMADLLALRQVGDPKAILSKFFVSVETADAEPMSDVSFLGTAMSGVSGGVSGCLQTVDKSGLLLGLPAPCWLLVIASGAGLWLLNAIWILSSCSSISALANVSMALALSAHTHRVQLSVYNISASWRLQPGQDTPNR